MTQEDAHYWRIQIAFSWAVTRANQRLKLVGSVSDTVFLHHVFAAFRQEFGPLAKGRIHNAQLRLAQSFIRLALPRVTESFNRLGWYSDLGMAWPLRDALCSDSKPV